MLRCYFVGLCVGSVIDAESNNMTLFGMVEGFQVLPPFDPDSVTAFQCHAYLEIDQPVPVAPVEELKFDVRFVWCDPANVSSPAIENLVVVPMTKSRMRVRGVGTKLPPTPGYYRLCVEWRKHETVSDWIRAPQGWPVEISAIAAGALDTGGLIISPIVTHV